MLNPDLSASENVAATPNPLLQAKLPLTDFLRKLSETLDEDVGKLKEAKLNALKEARQDRLFIDSQIENRKRYHNLDIALFRLIAGRSKALSAQDILAFKRAHPPTTPAEAQAFARIGKLLRRVVLDAHLNPVGESATVEVQESVTRRLIDLEFLDQER
jgi:hypothetical protein